MRSSKKRSLLIVNEHFESKRNDKVALLDSFSIFISTPTQLTPREYIIARYYYIIAQCSTIPLLYIAQCSTVPLRISPRHSIRTLHTFSLHSARTFHTVSRLPHHSSPPPPTTAEGHKNKKRQPEDCRLVTPPGFKPGTA